VVGASAGGVEALVSLCRQLPSTFPVPVLVVLHIAARGSSALPAILSRAGQLPAAHPKDGEPLRAGRVYVAPPDQHLVVDDGHVHLDRGPRENGHRPAIDVLFRSAAAAFGDGTVAVVLSGLLDDGSAGAVAVRSTGGRVVVQDPDDALYGDMPRNAMKSGEPDTVAPVSQIGGILTRMVRPDAVGSEPVHNPGSRGTITDVDPALEDGDPDTVPGLRRSAYACPECSGVLWESDEAVLRFRCRVGHRFSLESLLTEHGTALEATLWAAVRMFSERAGLVRRLAESARLQARERATRRFEASAHEAEERAEVLRRLLERLDLSSPSAEETIDAVGGAGMEAAGGDG
jgi:two-component system chemotaxis response regulator CheB